MPLSLAERTDLANDPRMKDDQIRLQVFAKISPEDQAWLTEAMKGTGPHVPDAPGAFNDLLAGAGNYIKNNPRKVGAAVGGIGATLATGGAALLPEMAAAGLGGMAGAGTGMTFDAIRQFMGGAPSAETLPGTPGDTAKAMIDEGAGQMAATGIGGSIARVARGAGTAVMNGILPKSIAEDFPQAAETLAKNAINPSTERGLEKASGLRRVSAANTRDLAQAAEQSGAPPITEGDILPSMGNSIGKAVAERKAGNPGGAGVIRRRIDALFSAQPRPTSAVYSVDAPIAPLALPAATNPQQMSPRFIGGAAGVAENRPYTIDTGPVTPRIGQPDIGTILPREVEGLSSVPPDMAARGIGPFTPPTSARGFYSNGDTGGALLPTADKGQPLPQPAQVVLRRSLIHGEPAIPLSDASDITRELQHEGRATLNAISSAERPSNLPSIVANDLASGIRRTANARIPGYQASNATTQGLIGAEQASAAMKNAPFPLKALGYRAMPALAIGSATGYATGSPTEGVMAGALPLALGVPQIAGPAAIAAYKAGSLPYSMLIKAVSPQILEMLGITPPNLAQQAAQGK